MKRMRSYLVHFVQLRTENRVTFDSLDCLYILLHAPMSYGIFLKQVLPFVLRYLQVVSSLFFSVFWHAWLRAYREVEDVLEAVLIDCV